MSPDNLLQDEGDEVDIFEEENARINNQSRTNYASGYKQGPSVDPRRENDRYTEANNNTGRNSGRPKTGHRNTYNVDSSYYLDDPNY